MKKGALPLALVLSAIATPASAHLGQGSQAGFFAGLLHPLTGVDHLLTMLMVGLWAGIAFPKRWWACPTAFVGFMLLGFVYDAGGGRMPVAELLILMSLVGLGLALVFEIRPPLAASAAIVALFAIGHGFAHGSEMAEGANGALFAGGFVVTTLLLHAAGLGLSRAAVGLQPRQSGQAVGMLAIVTAATMMWST